MIVIETRTHNGAHCIGLWRLSASLWLFCLWGAERRSLLSSGPTMNPLALHSVLLALLFVTLAPSVAAQPASDAAAESGATVAEPFSDMVQIEAGRYSPLYKTPSENDSLEVDAFELGQYPVTNAAFLAFVEANPRWRRSQVKALFADEHYLEHWAGDRTLGPDAPPNHPVVHVSWFAAQAYARWRDARLPSTAEWEYAARASANQRDGYRDPTFKAQVLNDHSRKRDRRAVRDTEANAWGAHGMHTLVWEWVSDFNAQFIGGDARNNSSFDQRQFCGSGALNATDFEDYAAFLRFGFRTSLRARDTTSRLGFRLARDAASEADSEQETASSTRTANPPPSSSSHAER